MGGGLLNQGRANLLIAMSGHFIYMGHRADCYYKNSKVYNYYCTRIGSAKL